MGFILPELIQPKLFFQAVWKTKESWDAGVNEDIKRKFLKRFKSLHLLKSVKLLT